MASDNNPIVRFVFRKLKNPRGTPELSRVGLAVVDKNIDGLGKQEGLDFVHPLRDECAWAEDKMW
jgi:hypothetical protein